jgi:hypothetical protein
LVSVPARLRGGFKGSPAAEKPAVMGAKLGVENPGQRNVP